MRELLHLAAQCAQAVFLYRVFLIPYLQSFTTSGVQIGPGATPFTRIPFGAILRETLRVKLTIAPLVAA